MLMCPISWTLVYVDVVWGRIFFLASCLESKYTSISD